MAAITLIIVVVILIIIIALNLHVRDQSGYNRKDMERLQKSINDIKQKLVTLEDRLPESRSKEKVSESSAPLVAETDLKEEVYEEPVVNFEAEPEPITEPLIEEPATAEEPVKPLVEKPGKPAAKQSFFEKYPDLERFIGENLINKIGIVILVLGIGFLVKYAIDKNWINEIGRVAIGVLSAGGLIGLAHKLQKNYKSFSSVLIGGGLAILYFTVTLAYHMEGYPLYHQQTLAFLLLVFITIFAVFLSIAYNRVEVAILAILGGFSSPLMVSNGSGNYITLFSYLMLLNVGMLVLSYFKKWRLINIVSFAFTVLLFGAWLIGELIKGHHENFVGGVFFATGFYVIFFLMNIIYNIKHDINFKAGDITLLLSNTFTYFTFVMLMLPYINNGAYKGLFSILLGLFNFGFAYFTHVRKKTDTNLLYLLIGLVFTFVTLAIPLQLKGNYITLFWSAESVLLLWLGQKSGFKIMKIGSVLVGILMLISIVMDWFNNYESFNNLLDEGMKHFTIIFNKMFITTLVSGASLIATSVLLKRENEAFIGNLTKSVYRALVFSATILVFFIGGFLETRYHANYYFMESSSKLIPQYTFCTLFILAVSVLAINLKNKVFTIVTSALSNVYLLILLIALSTVFVDNVAVLATGTEDSKFWLYLFRWISVIAAYCMAFLSFNQVNILNKKLKNDLYKANMVFLVFVLLYFLSADLDAFAILATKSRDVLVNVHKTGYAILWGLSSFVLMIIGMKRKDKVIRIISLFVFAITIAKLFIHDISNISEGGKIIAFILLGALLLTISFMYQKLKKLIVDEELVENNMEKENDQIT